MSSSSGEMRSSRRCENAALPKMGGERAPSLGAALLKYMLKVSWLTKRARSASSKGGLLQHIAWTAVGSAMFCNGPYRVKQGPPGGPAQLFERDQDRKHRQRLRLTSETEGGQGSLTVDPPTAFLSKTKVVLAP